MQNIFIQNNQIRFSHIEQIKEDYPVNFYIPSCIIEKNKQKQSRDLKIQWKKICRDGKYFLTDWTRKVKIGNNYSVTQNYTLVCIETFVDFIINKWFTKIYEIRNSVVYWPPTRPNMPFQRRRKCIFHWRGRAWLTIWDRVKILQYSHKLMHRKRVTCELHDSYFRSMTIKHTIPKTVEVHIPMASYVEILSGCWTII